MDKYLGTVLDKRYEILEVLGTGGMAMVYKARDNRLNRLVAVKILKDDLALDADFRRRFQTESQAVAMLSSPNIVAVYDVSKSDDVEYIVMELIEGITLKQYMNRKGRLNWKESLHFATQITKALSHAHSRGIIHRDIKPHNIMILKDGSVKVADFGIARLQDNQGSTLTQEALGSVHYISPEQAKGVQVDSRTDIYSVGVVLYEMLTSRLPFEGDSAVSVAIQHISSIPLSPREINPEVPAGLESIAMKAMNPSLHLRYQTVDEMLRDLEEFRKNPSMVFPYGVAAAAAAPRPGVGAPPPVHHPPPRRPHGAEGHYPPRHGADPEARPGKSQKEREREAYHRRKQKARRVSTLLGIGIVIFVLAMIFFVLVPFLNSFLDPEQAERHEVTDFSGMYIDNVLNNRAFEEYYNFEVQEEDSETHPEGVIFRQTPMAGRNVAVDDDGRVSVILFVARSVEIIEMPDLFNMSYEAARSILNNLPINLNIQMREQSHESVTENFVIETWPARGERLLEGMTVQLMVSTGPDERLVIVPNLYGQSFQVAVNNLHNLDLVHDVTHEHSSAVSGTVIGQSIPAGTEVAARTRIVLTVSLGPEPTPEPTPTPEPPPTPPPPTPPPPNGNGDED